VISAGELASIQADFGGVFLRATATVYTDDPNTGRSTVSVKTGLACWLANLGSDSAVSFDQRAELTERRQFFFDPTYIMPAVCEVETVDPATGGLQRFNPVVGTFVAQAAPDGTVLTRRVDVRRTKL
jgi:hypothetical protein